MSDHVPDIHDQASAYAIGALSPQDEASFREHFATCATCQREVADLAEVASAMSDAVAAEPPPGLRAAVLAEVARTPQLPVDTPTGAAEPGVAAIPRQAAASGSRDSNGVLRRSRSSRAPLLVAAAAVLAALAFGGLAYENQQDANDAAAQADQLTSLLSAADVQAVRGSSPNGADTGALLMSRDEGEAILVAANLPELQDNKVYEAWTIKGSEAPAPAGTFTPENAESVALPPATFDANTVAITVEPVGGSDAPTTDPIVTFAIPPA